MQSLENFWFEKRIQQLGNLIQKPRLNVEKFAENQPFTDVFLPIYHKNNNELHERMNFFFFSEVFDQNLEFWPTV